MSHATASARQLHKDPMREFQKRLDQFWSYTGGIRRQLGEELAQMYGAPVDSLNEEYERRQGLTR